MEPEVHNFLRLYFMRYAVSEFKKFSIFNYGFPGKRQNFFGVLLHNNHSKQSEREREREVIDIYTYIYNSKTEIDIIYMYIYKYIFQ